MSAFICSEYHIGRMAAFLVAERGQYLQYDVALAPDADPAGQVAAMLARENLASVNHCYQDSGGAEAQMADGITAASYVLRCKLAARARWAGEHTPGQMMKAARCYEHQSCEHPEWEASQGRALSNLVYREAADLLLDSTAQGDGWELEQPAARDPARSPRGLASGATASVASSRA